jgi:hypothetical protein
MNLYQTTTSAPADDSRVLSLFHDWLELYRAAKGIPNSFEGDKEFDAARERLDAIATEAIAEVPAAAAAGIAIKAFLRLQIDPTDMKLLRPLERSLLEDAARFVPELARLVANLVRQGDVDVEPQVVGFGERESNKP